MRSLPKDFLRALRQSGLDDFFVTCPYVPRREYLRWISAARRPATRRWRIQKSVVRLFAQWTAEMNLVRASFAAAHRPLPGTGRRSA
jgi:hypothetical protein